MPQALRTLVRFYVILIIPIFYGPYYASISMSTGSFVFVVAFSVMVNLASLPSSAIYTASFPSFATHTTIRAGREMWLISIPAGNEQEICLGIGFCIKEQSISLPSSFHTPCLSPCCPIRRCFVPLAPMQTQALRSAFSLQMHLGMAVLLNATIGLEDPFATDGVDGIFVEEVLFEVQQVHTLVFCAE